LGGGGGRKKEEENQTYGCKYIETRILHGAFNDNAVFISGRTVFVA
jgi:hypothetical protein